MALLKTYRLNEEYHLSKEICYRLIWDRAFQSLLFAGAIRGVEFKVLGSFIGLLWIQNEQMLGPVMCLFVEELECIL